MPVKRSRMVQSSSAGDTGVVSADNRWKNRSDPSTPVGKTSDSDKPREPHDQTRRTVLTLASPVREHIGVSGEEGGKIGNFLEKCYYCKKKIEEDSEVFMYSNLQAFCTAECREIHIAMEKELEKVAGQSAEPTTQQQGEKRTMDQFGLVHKGNHAGS